jgi:2-polyprenyl-3-methyl-5-hydroxy-6-metoxy-1,4-benzoquinol methylase
MNHLIGFIEDRLHDYCPGNFITLEEWNYHLNQQNKYLVKGHKAIKEYYQNLEVASKYNEERFLEYPANCFDAFERVSIDIAFESIRPNNDLRILDIASGDGRIVQEDIKYGLCTAADSSQAMLNIVQSRYGSTGKVITKQCDFFVDSIEDKYDVITTFRYIRHFDYLQRKQVYKKIWDSLSEGGMLVFDAPNIRYAMQDRSKGNWGEFNIYDVFWTEETISQELISNQFTLKYLIPVGIRSVEREPISWTVVAIKTCR